MTDRLPVHAPWPSAELYSPTRSAGDFIGLLDTFLPASTLTYMCPEAPVWAPGHRLPSTIYIAEPDISGIRLPSYDGNMARREEVKGAALWHGLYM